MTENFSSNDRQFSSDLGMQSRPVTPSDNAYETLIWCIDIGPIGPHLNFFTQTSATCVRKRGTR